MKRKDKLRNKAKIIKELVKNPELTERQIAKRTNLANGTVHNHIKQNEQKGAESQIIDKILKMDDEIMDLANQITIQKIKESAPKDENGNIIVNKLSLSDIRTIGDLANNSTKRKVIFGKKSETKDITIKFEI